MADNFHQMIADSVDDMMTQVKERVSYWIEDTWPSLIELKKPAERLAWYRTIDWNALRDTSELFWAKLSADAKRLMAEQEQGMEPVNNVAAAMADYEQQAHLERRAFTGETQPFGTQPLSDTAYALGYGSPLPMGNAA